MYVVPLVLDSDNTVGIDTIEQLSGQVESMVVIIVDWSIENEYDPPP